MATAQDSIAGWNLGAFLSTIHEGRVALWSWDPEAGTAVLDPLARRLWGAPGGEAQTLEALFALIHEEDRAAAREAWIASAESEGPYEFDFRVTGEDGETRWISARGVGGETGRRGSDVLAVFVDVTRLHESRDLQSRLIGEMAHRTANLFTVAQSMARLASAETDDVSEMARELERRFTGLASVYRFAVTDQEGLPTAPLPQLVVQVTAPFDPNHTVTVRVPDVPVSGRQIANVALILHELATNALKHGALSSPDGRVEIEGTLDGGRLRLSWREIGGPVLAELPEARGFGSRLVERTVTRVFGGTFERHVADGALAVTLALDADKLAD